MTTIRPASSQTARGILQKRVGATSPRC